jgi:hypothetical protein
LLALVVLGALATPLASPLFAQATAPSSASGGEASLIIPDLSQVSFLGVNGHTLLMSGLVVCALGLLFGLLIYNRLKNMAVHQSMRDISELIYETCKTYLQNQGKFIEKEKLEIPLLADPEKKATKLFEALNPERGAAFRYTFVIDREGKIAKIYKTVNPTKHPEEVLNYVKENLGKK